VPRHPLGEGPAGKERRRNSRWWRPREKDWGNRDYWERLAGRFDFSPLLGERGGRNRLCLNSVVMWHVMTGVLPVLAEKSPQRYVPEQILQAPLRLVARFLRGLFTAEGCVGHHQVTITMSSRRVIDSVQWLLRRFGIICERDTSPSGFDDHDYDRLLISDRASLDTFEQEIGFSSEQKSTALKRVNESPRSEKKGRRDQVNLNLAHLRRTAGEVGV